MERLTYLDEIYEVNSMYLLPDNAWAYELTAVPSERGRAGVIVLIPDATPEGPFMPMSAVHCQVMLDDGGIPWPILCDFLRIVEDSGDLVPDEPDVPVIGDLAHSLNKWQFADRSFEVNSYHLGDGDCWCYELYEINIARMENDYLEVRIPDAQPDEGPFLPAPEEQVTVHAHGSWTLPWPVFRHLFKAIHASGDITGI